MIYTSLLLLVVVSPVTSAPIGVRVRRQTSNILCLIESMRAKLNCADDKFGRWATEGAPLTRGNSNVQGTDVGQWQTAHNQANRANLGANAGIDLAQALGKENRLPGSDIGGNVGINAGEDGFSVGRQAGILGVVSGQDGIASTTDDRGNVLVSGGQRLGIWGDTTAFNNQAGVRGGPDGVGLGRQLGVDGVFDNQGTLNVDDKDGRVEVSGGQSLGILGDLFGIGHNAGVSVDKNSGNTNLSGKRGIDGIFTQTDNVDLGIGGGQWGGGQKTCIFGICGGFNTGFDFSKLG